MHTFKELFVKFEEEFSRYNFPSGMPSLYEPCSYLLHLGGKRIRPVSCLMAHELFAELDSNAMNTAIAIELFHNFTLMHDDIMDKAPLRRGQTTVHEKYSLATAILSGDVMNIFSYVHLNKIGTEYIHAVMELFNKTAIQICEGQQLDMDFESRDFVSVEEYGHMIMLKTSVLLGTSIQLGAMLGGASNGCSSLLYEYGKTMGIAFQLKDDYLDSFGTNTGKQCGGDILSNKKTYLPAKAYEMSDDAGKAQLIELLHRKDENKVKDTLAFYSTCGVKDLLMEEVEKETKKAYALLEEVPVLSKRKIHLLELTESLLHREF